REGPARVLLEELRPVVALSHQHTTVLEYLVAVARHVEEKTVGAVLRPVRGEQVIVYRPHIPVALSLTLDCLVDIIAAVVEAEIPSGVDVSGKAYLRDRPPLAAEAHLEV